MDADVRMPVPFRWLGTTEAERLRAVLARSGPRFLAVGGLGFLCDALAFAALRALGLPEWAARAVSLPSATLVTWRLNRRFTFAASGRRPLAEALRYALVALCSQGFNYVHFLAVRALLPALGVLPALVASAGLAAVLSFLGQRFFTFATLRSAPSPACLDRTAGVDA